MASMFSIITVVKNDSLGLDRTLQSIFAQSYGNVQSIIIDGASVPSIEPICSMFVNIALCISEEDSGVYNAMNKGLAGATGGWTMFLNAGDIFYDRTVLATLATFLSTLSMQESIVCAPSIEMLADMPIVRSTENIAHMPLAMPACHQSICYRTSVIKHYPFNEEYKICADLEQMARLLADGHKPSYCKFAIATVDGRGLSNRLWRLAIQERRRVQQKFYPSLESMRRLRKYHRVLKAKNLLRMLMPLSVQLTLRSYLAKKRTKNASMQDNSGQVPYT